jgi:hypothetical protein
MKEVLEYALHLGMKPPLDGPHSYSTHDWTPEPVCPVVKTQVDKLIRVDMGPHAGRDYKKDLFADKLPKKKNDDDDDSGNFPCGAV